METQLSMSLFHNTIDLPESELKARQLKAGSQNARVLEFFRLNPDNSYTPGEIKTFCCFYNSPLTSIRRAMTDLTKLGYLEKTKEKRAGEYGIDNFTWRLLIK